MMAVVVIVPKSAVTAVVVVVVDAVTLSRGVHFGAQAFGVVFAAIMLLRLLHRVERHAAEFAIVICRRARRRGIPRL